MKTKHTDGPWAISEREWEKIESGAVGIDIDAQYGPINLATVWTTDNEDDEGRYNAKLIAAAPEMLEALLSIENDDNSIPAAIWEMRNAAIKKATE